MELCSGFCPSWTCSLKCKRCVFFFGGGGKKKPSKKYKIWVSFRKYFRSAYLPIHNFCDLAGWLLLGRGTSAKTPSWTLQSCLILEQSLEPPSWSMANQLHIFFGRNTFACSFQLPSYQHNQVSFQGANSMNFMLELVVYNTCVYIYIAH